VFSYCGDELSVYVLVLRVQGFCEMMIPLVTSPAYNKAIISSITSLIPSSTVPNTVRIQYPMCLNNNNNNGFICIAA